MIIRIWPVKKSQLTQKIHYVKDKEKGLWGDIRTRAFPPRHILQEVEMDHNGLCVARYISGYLCSPYCVEDNFKFIWNLIVRERGLDKEPTSDCIVAYHIVQSFPADLSISAEEVHQCGIELLEQLGDHQGVVCTQRHKENPDEPEEPWNNCMHNHILINAYKMPSKLDPEHKNQVKYRRSNENYQKLTVWNDQIAIRHGLPIINDPDMNSRKSWVEVQKDKKGGSWKGNLKKAINEVGKFTSTLPEFIGEMRKKGCEVIVRGEDVKYILSEKQQINGRSLGKKYARDALERQWESRDVDRRIAEAKKREKQRAVLKEVDRQRGPLTAEVAVGVPMGNKRKKTKYQLQELATKDAYNTYFALYDEFAIWDKNGEYAGMFLGTCIIDYMEELRKHIDRNYAVQLKSDSSKKIKNDKDGQKESDLERLNHTDNFYYNAEFRDTVTNEHYKIPKNDKNGERISPLRLIYLLAIVILKKEDGRWNNKEAPEEKKNHPIYAKTDWKIQNMLDCIAIAREEGVFTPAEIDEQLQIVGATYSRMRSSLKRLTASRDATEPIAEAAYKYRSTAEIALKILAMPEGEERTKAEQEYRAELMTYKEAEDELYNHGITRQEQLTEFVIRYNGMQQDIERLQEELNGSKEKYRRLKKLQYYTELAQNAQYVYGHTYNPDRVVTATGVKIKEQNDDKKASEIS